VTGGYRAIDAPWHETRIVNCELCGQMLPRRAFHDERDAAHRFCSPSCADLWFARRLREQPGPATC
jgi:hypothetical protein